MIIYGIRMDMLTKYVSGLVYVLLYLSYSIKSKRTLYYVNNALSVLYGPMCAVAMCGLLINGLFHKEIRKRDNTSTLVRVGSDIFGHILPFVLLSYYGPAKTDVSLPLYLASVALFFFVFRSYLVRAYVGVPKALLLGVAPAICIAAYYLRYVYAGGAKIV